MKSRHLGARSLADVRDDLLDGAACLFDPELHDGPADGVETAQEQAVREDIAKDVCGACPVFSACEVYAFRVPPRFGIWAGRRAEEITRVVSPTSLKEVA